MKPRADWRTVGSYPGPAPSYPGLPNLGGTSYGRRHLFIPDLQAKPGVPLDHIYWIALYAMDLAADVVVLAGDVYDMESLSCYDKRGSKSAEGRRVRADFDAGDKALEILWGEWITRGYAPERHVTLGNHENRRERAIDEDPHLLEGIMREYAFKDLGWTPHGFLTPVKVDGVRYSHFFPHNADGGITQTRRGAPNARVQVVRQMCSATAGHRQGLSVHVQETPDGLQRGLIAGSCYLHNEDYMPSNDYWRGVLVKHRVRYGRYDLMEVGLDYLRDTYSRLCPRGVFA